MLAWIGFGYNHPGELSRLLSLFLIVCWFLRRGRRLFWGGWYATCQLPSMYNIYIVRVYADVDRRTRSAPDSIGADLVYCVFILVLY